MKDSKEFFKKVNTATRAANEPSRAQSIFDNSGVAHFRGHINEPVSSSSRAGKPLLELGSLGRYNGSGLSSGSLQGQFRVDLSTRVARLGLSSLKKKKSKQKLLVILFKISS
jgi:hypothetical protein